MVPERFFSTDDWLTMWEAYRDSKPKRHKQGSGITYWKRLAQRADDVLEKAAREERAKLVLSFIDRSFPLTPGLRVLDVGAGDGTLSIPLAQKGIQVTALDVTTDILNILQKKADQQQVQIETVCADWREIELQQYDWIKRFDLVIASHTPAVSTHANFQKLEEASKGAVYYASFTRPHHNHFQDILWPEIVGEEITEMNYGVCFVFNWLYSRGIVASVEEFTVQFQKTEALTEVVEELYEYYSVFTELSPEKMQVLEQVVRQRAMNDRVTRSIKMTTGSVIWQVKSEVNEEKNQVGSGR